jgi:hypothetical protein
VACLQAAAGVAGFIAGWCSGRLWPERAASGSLGGTISSQPWYRSLGKFCRELAQPGMPMPKVPPNMALPRHSSKTSGRLGMPWHVEYHQASLRKETMMSPAAVPYMLRNRSW